MGAEHILGLDLGTQCGWCLAEIDRRAMIGAGVWDCRENRFEGRGMRFIRFVSFLDKVHATNPLKMVAVEEVHRHVATAAAHIYGGFLSHVQSWCERNKIAYTGVPVASIKKLATGKGNSKKDAMIAAANAKWPSAEIVDDNHADALWLTEYVLRSLVAA